MAPLIRLHNIEKAYRVGHGQTYVLRRITFDVEEGEFITIMGPSGAGKTTLLHILGMLDGEWGGEYSFLEHAVHRMKPKQRNELAKQHIGFVFQSYHLLDNLTVAENLEVPLSYRNIKRAERQALVADTLDRFQIVGKKDLFPNQLSGGQQQLVGVARAVIMRPKVIFADEPTGNLHSEQGREIMELFSKLNEQGTTIIQVTHSEDNAAYSRRIIRLKDGWLHGEELRRAAGAGPMNPMAETPRILIADDQPDVQEALRLLVKGEGFAAELVSSPEAILEALKQRDFDVLLMDLNYTRDTTSGAEGLDLLSRIQALDSTLPVVVMTAWASVEVAVEAMRRGARDFIEKPWDNARLLSVLRTQVELGRALRRGQRLEAENQLLRGEEGPTLIAESPAMEPVLELIERVGPSEANVLITGENGTGKGVVAQALHALSPRAQRPMVTVNAGSLAEAVFESELFGHVRGAFTDAKSDRVGRFELADGGTLFLDEIANVPPAQQAKLLRVVETGELERVGSSKTRRVSVRLLAATNADLDREVAEGRFRRDLLFRLNTVEIRVPPLRQRREDIPVLARHFLAQHGPTYHKELRGFSEQAMQELLAHDWPGNVRELSHAVERGVLLARGEVVEAGDLGLQLQRGGAVRDLEEMTLEEVEQVLIRKALARCGGRVTDAARDLGLSRSALYRRIEKYGL